VAPKKNIVQRLTNLVECGIILAAAQDARRGFEPSPRHAGLHGADGVDEVDDRCLPPVTRGCTEWTKWTKWTVDVFPPSRGAARSGRSGRSGRPMSSRRHAGLHGLASTPSRQISSQERVAVRPHWPQSGGRPHAHCSLLGVSADQWPECGGADPCPRGRLSPEGGTRERPGLARAKSRAHGIPTEDRRDEGAACSGPLLPRGLDAEERLPARMAGRSTSWAPSQSAVPRRRRSGSGHIVPGN
jgi:hypothetical protein